MFTIEDIIDKIVCGHVLDVLAQIPSESIDMCVTSPPYFGLRSYGTEPQIWDEDKNCRHEWSAEIKKPINLQSGNPEYQRPWRELATDKNATQGRFCSKCGAWKGELGLEPTVELYINHLMQVFNEVQRILKPSGSCYINIADSYNRFKRGNTEIEKNPRVATNLFTKFVQAPIQIGSQCAIPERLIIAMLENGWAKLNTIIWHKPNAMTFSGKRRFTNDYESFLFFVKNEKNHYFEQQFEPYQGKATSKAWHSNKPAKAVGSQDRNGHSQWERNGQIWQRNKKGRNKRTVWRINTKGYRGAHFATFAPELIKIPIQASCPLGGIVVDPFIGSGTTAMVAKQLDRHYIGIDLNPSYTPLQQKRLTEMR
jgi:site-specific DNA-methyltransferase (adenine-specific)